MKKNKPLRPVNDRIVDKESEESLSRTIGARSQSELRQPVRRRKDMPEADRPHFHHGVYSGTGTGAALGSTAETGGADTAGMEDNARMGTTGNTTGRPLSGGSIDRSSAMADQDAAFDRPEARARRKKK